LKNIYSSFSATLFTGFLIGGYTIGAGILGLPIMTGLAGFIPTSVVMFFIWIVLYGFAWFMAKLFIARKDDTCDYITLFGREIGSVGKWIAFVGFLIIYYGALTAYLAGAAGIIKGLFDLQFSDSLITVCCFIAYSIIIVYSIKAVEKGNFLFMLILIISFIYLIFTIAPSVKVQNYTYIDWKFMPCIFAILIFSSIPFLIVPTACRRLNYSSRSILISLIIGGGISFLISYIWTAAVIGALPLTGNGVNNILYAYKNSLSAAVPLANVSNSQSVFLATAIFSILAISTSYLGTGVAIIGFVKDFDHFKFKIKNKYVVFIVAFLPSLLVTIFDPNIFLNLLNFVGGVGFCLVGGVIPSIIYIRESKSNICKLLFGYFLLILFSLIVLFELLQKCGLLDILPVIK
jgi:tyrosine-specific transport protein